MWKPYYFLIFCIVYISDIAHIVRGYDPYPYNPRMHTLGNHGLLGRVRAEIGPIFTRFVDKVVYERNIRKEVIESFGNKRILDIGCGTGFSTSDTPGSVGIDTSVAMVEKARREFPNKTFRVGHAEHWHLDGKVFDIISIMFCFHEIPQYNRKKIIQKYVKAAKEEIVIVDISPEYIPSKAMLMGEPYLPDYLENIREDLHNFSEEVLIENHVHLWSLKKDS